MEIPAVFSNVFRYILKKGHHIMPCLKLELTYPFGRACRFITYAGKGFIGNGTQFIPSFAHCKLHAQPLPEFVFRLPYSGHFRICISRNHYGLLPARPDLEAWLDPRECMDQMMGKIYIPLSL